MATVKIILRAVVNKDGTSPLALRITKDRKSSFIHMGYHVKPEEWDADRQRVKKTHPNSVRLNNFLLKKLAEASDTTIEAETIRHEVSSKALMAKVKPKSSSLFFVQAELYLDNLKLAGKYNQYTADKSRIKNFRAFLNGSDIIFPEITIALLERLKLYLTAQLKLSERSAINHWVIIRSVFSQAIKDNLVDEKYYPFGRGKIVIKFPESNKVGLSAEEVRLLETVDLSQATYHHARNLFLVSFYFAGMRVSDVLRLKWSDFRDDRLHYTMGKNAKAGSLKIPAKAMTILAQYEADRQHKDDYIFPELKRLQEPDNKFLVQRQIGFSTSRIDKFLRLHVAPLAGIDKKLTMHIARHSFGNISANKIPIHILQRFFRHSDLSTTAGYMANFNHQEADDALDLVIGS